MITSESHDRWKYMYHTISACFTPPLDCLTIQRMASGGEFATGSVLTLTTSLGEEIAGATVLAFDSDADCLLLREPGAHNGVATIRIVKV